MSKVPRKPVSSVTEPPIKHRKPAGSVAEHATDSGAAQDCPEDLLDDQQAAKRLGISKSTLRSWRCRGIGPVFVKMGPGKKAPVRYDNRDLAQFVEDGRQLPSVLAALKG